MELINRFRPGRSAHQAVGKAQQCVADGYRWVVHLALEKFFDRANHDKLMAFLTAGVMEEGLVHAVDEGTPQGGQLSPLLSNIVLDELEQRGLRSVRYADDEISTCAAVGPGNE